MKKLLQTTTKKAKEVRSGQVRSGPGYSHQMLSWKMVERKDVLDENAEYCFSYLHEKGKTGRYRDNTFLKKGHIYLPSSLNTYLMK
jgi:hypothetical protein